ncbi:NAD-dependent epimerase/dehydratase family protein [Acidithiobacillus sp. VAN18-1]|uniref:NAD-dependent epimerase/dehydratase family protein n=1 Tax=Igneacidithiobacillus copahuensis TaxID=2724909 RepID=A0AAE2YQB3_9PROT|nr:NAD-dependent epimerase/dehydratase family protein [Igneacidithiobacillus copahuensis]MBU2788199.1 NAD-dependent epimerase/dehydratase family protein [Igneacidithiobacillus copahuensis]MBU2795470.1 NAD-dependent epimerase/dehydratase family protein [Acidithiobacillus sp. VAN18-2]
MKRILVTGGAGFIGSHTVDLLLAEGHQVRVLDNFSTGKRSNLPVAHPHLEVIAGELASAQLLREACQSVDAVLHLAAQVSVQKSIEDPVASCAQNIQNFVALLEMARQQEMRVVYASSAAVYGDPQTLPLCEGDAVDPISPYGLEKYSNELYAQLYEKMYGLSHLGLRYFNVYGPRQDPSSPYSGVISRFIDQARSGKPLTIRGDGLQERDFIHVHDVARANVAALRGDMRGVLNIASGTATTIHQLAESICSLIGDGDLAWMSSVPGDIRHSRADVSNMNSCLGVPVQISLNEGLRSLLDPVIQAAARV